MSDMQPGDESWVDEQADRFERAWATGGRPRLEDHLADVEEPRRSRLLEELVRVERQLRTAADEAPRTDEYHRRFPGHAAAINAAFGEERATTSAGRPQSGDAGRSLLFGLLALQSNFVDRNALLAAFAVWVADKARPLGRILLEGGALDAETHALLEALVRKHLEMHGGDAERSLADLSSLGSARGALESVADPELQASLARVAADHTSDDGPDATQVHASGRSTHAGPRFRVLRFHAKGGLGQVSVARDEDLHRDVALKEIRDQFADDPVSRFRFVQEAEITGRLEHPGVIPVYGLGTYDDGRPFYAMRFIKGDNLKEAIKRFHVADAPGRDSGERALALHELLRRFLDVCNAIAYAHSRGVLHRDLKPQNILLGPYGETLVVDWGLAKSIGRPEGAAGPPEETLRPESGGKNEGQATLAGSQIGTPGYMSPEQARGEVDRLGPRSDVYSLGATLYCLLTGRAPLESRDSEAVLEKFRRGEFPPPRAIDRAVAPALGAICLKAMALRPEDRHGSPRDLADDLEHWLADEPVSAFRDPWAKRLVRWARRHRWAVRAAATLALLLPLGLTAAILAQHEYAKRKLEVARREAVEEKARTEQGAAKARQDALAKQLANFDVHVAAYHGAKAVKRDHRPEANARAIETLINASRRHPIPGDPMDLRREIAECLGEGEIGKFRDPEGRIFFEHPIKSLAVGGDGSRLAVLLAPAGGIDAIRTIRIVRFRGATRPGELQFEPGETLRWGEAAPPVRWPWDGGSRLGPRDVVRSLRAYLASRMETARELAISPDGRWVALGTSAGDVYLWDLDDARPGRPSTSWRAHDGPVHGLAFGHDSRALTSSGADKQLVRWSLLGSEGAQPVETARHQAGSRIGRLFTLDGHRRLFAVRDGRLCEFAGAGLECRDAGLDLSRYRPDVLALSPDGRFVAVANDSGVEVISAEDGARMRMLPKIPPNANDPYHGNTSALQFDPGSLHLLDIRAGPSSRSRMSKVWELASGREVFSYGGTVGEDYTVAFSPDGGHLFRTDHRSGSPEWTLFAYPVAPAIARSTFALTTRPSQAVALSGDGSMLACASAGRADPGGPRRIDVTLWDASDGRLLRRRLVDGMARGNDNDFALSFGPGGDRLAITESGGVILWEFAAEDALRRIDTGTARPFHAFPREGRLWGSIHEGGVDRLVVLDVTGEAPRPIELDPGTEQLSGDLWSRAICFPSGVGQALICTRRGTVEVFRDGARPAWIDSWGRARGATMTRVAVSPDGQLAVAGNNSGQLIAMRMPDGEILGVVGGHSRGFSSLSFSPDGRRLASGSADGTLRLWWVGETGPRDPIVLTGGGPDGVGIMGVGFSRDGRSLWVWSPSEYAVRRWDIDRLDEMLSDNDRRLAAFLASKATPRDPTEALGLAYFAYERGLHAASTRLFEVAFLAEPALAQSISSGHRYNAACAAALAGSGRGNDDPTPDAGTRDSWRAEARGWLREDLAILANALDPGDPRNLPTVVAYLTQCKTDSDLGGIRDEADLAALPAAEGDALRLFWAEVDALFAKVSAMTTRERPGGPNPATTPPPPR